MQWLPRSSPQIAEKKLSDTRHREESYYHALAVDSAASFTEHCLVLRPNIWLQNGA